jgi:catechol 2,3-dioxygenase-like lactoylglutathione lyase family enzyme
MLGYATVGSNNLPAANAFYAELLAEIGLVKLFDHKSGGTIFGQGTQIRFVVLGPFNEQPATAGNGTMISFQATSREQAAGWHAKALSLGAIDEGAPGPRGPSERSPFYGGYVRDLDGNKLCFYHWAM